MILKKILRLKIQQQHFLHGNDTIRFSDVFGASDFKANTNANYHIELIVYFKHDVRGPIPIAERVYRKFFFCVKKFLFFEYNVQQNIITDGTVVFISCFFLHFSNVRKNKKTNGKHQLRVYLRSLSCRWCMVTINR